MYGLRVVDDDSVVTDDNIRQIVEGKKALKITDSPGIMATTFLATLTNSNLPSSTLKLTLFNLQKYIKEQEFCEEFVKQGGDKEMVKLIKRLEGNSLAVSRSSLSRSCSKLVGGVELTFFDLFSLLSTLSKPSKVSQLNPVETSAPSDRRSSPT